MKSHLLSQLNLKPSTVVPSQKVFVGLSGGVDSSVSAALLKQAGYAVTGVFIKVWQPDWIECTWKEDRLDAMRVCAKLNIPFVELNLEEVYKREVVDYMLAEYTSGRTPNPDVMCNKYVKFGGFYNWALKQGADYVATGHYARIGSRVDGGGYRQKNQVRDELNPTPYTLRVGIDSAKDQSYFLWQIRREQLSHILFPVGGMLKPEVRKLAKKFGLVTANKKDSQGLCFIGKIDMKDFLKKYIKALPGDVLDTNGKKIGAHDGAVFYTIGERHGFSIINKSVSNSPYYVVSKNVKNNTLVVSQDRQVESDEVSRKIFKIKDLNLISDSSVGNVGKNTLSARLRYRQPVQKCTVTFDKVNSTAEVSFEKAQDGGAPGQSIVLYSGSECLGGGTIV